MTLVRFEPLDTLFFRDGRPYEQGEASQAGVVSRFPPPPPTLVGAVRAGLARSMGWKCGGWSADICARLGNGADLGPLRFRGPVLTRNGESLFPAPAHLVGALPRENEDFPKSLAFLSPGCDLTCDLGPNLPLPSAAGAAEGVKPLFDQGWWMTVSGLAAVLRGNAPAPENLVHRRDLWREEPRVGILRSRDARVTAEGALYSPSHVRLGRGTALAVEARGLPPHHADALRGRPHPVGGEARACWLRLLDERLGFPEPPRFRPAQGPLLYTATILTPADTKAPPRPGEHGYAGLPGRVVSACLPRPTLVGGWDSQAGRPLALRPHLSPGSVLFLEAERDDASRVEALHGAAIGARAAWGFGLVAVGNWKRRNDRTGEPPQ